MMSIIDVREQKSDIKFYRNVSCWDSVPRPYGIMALRFVDFLSTASI